MSGDEEGEKGGGREGGKEVRENVSQLSIQ